jgi:type II secretory pathway component PulF
MKFSYRAFDRAGQVKADVLEAASAVEATEALRRQGLFVSEVAETKGDAPVKTAAPARGSSIKGGYKNVAAFMRHLSVLVSTGTPVVDALSALEKQATDERWKSVIGDVRVRVEDGAPFSEALAAYPRCFDTIARSLVRAGESGGKLDVMLGRLAELTRRQLKIRQSLIGAMVYPSLLIVVAINVLITMMVFVMPRFAGLFKTLDAPLPPTTKALMATSGFVLHWWWAILLALAATVTGVVLYLRSDPGRNALFTFAVRAPQVGRICRSFATARFARLMGLLLESKVPMLECLQLARDASVNVHYAALMGRIQEALTKGDTLSNAVTDGGLISPSVCEAVRNAERTGQVGPVLSSMADFLDEENEVLLKSLTSLIEPIILITLGLVVGTVAISMFLPLFDLTATAGAGGGGGGGGAP